MRTRTALVGIALLTGTGLVLLPATPASAHPMGNFSINEYVGLTLHADRVDARTVVDIAEIPTIRDRSTVDTDGDGTISARERSAYGGRTCADMAAAVSAVIGSHAARWSVRNADFAYSAGAGGLDISRLTCGLTAPTTVDGRTEVRVDNRYLADRVGWREMTAAGAGVRLVDSPLPAVSVSHELQEYPKDLLSSPLVVRSAVLIVEPGSDQATTAAPTPLGSAGDPLSRGIAALDRRFADLAGGAHLTIWVGLLAVLMAVMLGAGHAALPGHGKTVLAAYLAGRRGRPRDALVVAGTVTLTHTGGVLALGLLLTTGTALAGERILGWLALLSGLVVLGVGAATVAGLWRRNKHHQRRYREHDHHAHVHQRPYGEHDHGHVHEDDNHANVHSGRTHSARRQWGLAGIGVAGGLVPSPSALVVLLGAIGLGRTALGIVLVLAYGLGMAATLTGAGLLLVVLQRRLARAPRWSHAGSPMVKLAKRLSAATPVVTALLVVVVGASLAVRAASGVL